MIRRGVSGNAGRPGSGQAGRPRAAGIAPEDLRDHADEARIDRIWERLEVGLEGSRSTSRGSARRGSIAVTLLAATFAAFAAGVVLGKVVWTEAPAGVVAAPVRANDKLARDVLAAGTEPRSFPLPNGGRLQLEPGATVELEHAVGDQAAAVTLRLLHGAASVDTGASDLSGVAIVAGEARLAAQAGSALRVQRNERDLDVDVRGGQVQVSSPDGSSTYLGGERGAVSTHAVTSTAPTSTGKSRGYRPPAVAAEDDPQEPAAVAAAPAPDGLRVRYDRGEYDAAYQLVQQQAGGMTVAIKTAKSTSDLWLLRDVALRGGKDNTAAMSALKRIVDDFPGDGSSQAAALKLAQAYQSAGNAEEARRYNERAAKLKGALAEDAACQQMRTPNKDEALRLAKEYVTKYSDGRCKDEADRILEGAEPEPELAPSPVAPPGDAGAP